MNALLRKQDLGSQAVNKVGIQHSNSNSISFFLDYHSILLVDRNEWATVARGDDCAHVSLRGVFNGIPFGVFRCDLMVFPRNSMGIFLFQRVLGVIFPGVDCSFSLKLNSFFGSFLATMTFRVFSEYFTGLSHAIPLTFFPVSLGWFSPMFYWRIAQYFIGVDPAILMVFAAVFHGFLVFC